MSKKKKTKATKKTDAAAGLQTKASGGEDVKCVPAESPQQGPQVIRKTEYSFGTKSRCPRCGGTQTTATGKHLSTQYRRCLSPICRHKYSVEGVKI